MRHRLGTHDTRKLWHIGHACNLPSDRLKASHYNCEQVVKVVCNPAGKLTDSFELLRLTQRCFCLIATRNFFRYTLFKRGIQLLKSQGRSGYIFTRAIERFSEMRCVSCRLRGGTFACQRYMNPSFGFQ